MATDRKEFTVDELRCLVGARVLVKFDEPEDGVILEISPSGWIAIKRRNYPDRQWVSASAILEVLNPPAQPEPPRPSWCRRILDELRFVLRWMRGEI